jgi:hypothetical protein
MIEMRRAQLTFPNGLAGDASRERSVAQREAWVISEGKQTSAARMELYDLRPCGARKSISGPSGTMPVGFI